MGSGANFTCAKFTPNRCSLLAAGDDQSKIHVWKITETKPRRQMQGKSPAVSIIFNEQAKTMFTGTMSGMANAWDTE